MNFKKIFILNILISLVPILLVALIPKSNFLSGIATVVFYSGPLFLIGIIVSALGYFLSNNIIRKSMVVVLVLLVFLQYLIMVIYLKEIS